MPLVECRSGYATPSIAGNAYAFERDEYGRFVAQVEHPDHLNCLLSVEHYRIVPDVPDVPEPAADNEPAPSEPRARGRRRAKAEGNAAVEPEDGAAAEGDPSDGAAEAA